MIPMEEALAKLKHTLDRPTLEYYIEHTWVRPVAKDKAWYFEDIDIARVCLIHQLHTQMMVGDEAMEVVLSLLDQVYSYREKMQAIRKVFERQPAQLQDEIRALLLELRHG